MKEDRLDHIIKDKLQDLQVPYQEAHWELFAEQLDASQGGPALPNSEDFDAIIFNKLNDFPAATNKQGLHWAKLEKELDQLVGLRDQILQFKLVETILISLLLLIVVKWGVPETATDNSATDQLELVPLQAETPIASLEEKEIIPPALYTTPSKDLETNEGGIADQVSTTTNSSVPAVAANNKVVESNEADPNNDIANTLIQPLPSAAPSAVVLPDEVPSKLNTNEKNPTDVVATSETSSRSDLSVSSIDNITPTLSWTPKPFFFDPASLPKYRKLEFQISMLGGGEYNQVMTPYNDDKSINQFNRFSLGYRGGLTFDVGRSNSRLRLGSGLIYTAKQYDVGFLQGIQGSFLRNGGLTAEALENIELNIINIPVFARYNFLSGKRWSVFAQAGVSMQMALQSNYYVGYPTNLPQPTGVGQTPTRISLIGDRKDGLLGGGSFSENSFFTGNMGLGMERTMAERWSLFFQSRYEYSIGYFSDGLGPTHDRINTMSFESGVRVRLK